MVPGGQADQEPAIHLPANSFLGGTSKSVIRRLAEVVLSFHPALAGPHAGVLSFVFPHRSYGLSGWLAGMIVVQPGEEKAVDLLCGKQLPERSL